MTATGEVCKAWDKVRKCFGIEETGAMAPRREHLHTGRGLPVDASGRGGICTTMTNADNFQPYWLNIRFIRHGHSSTYYTKITK